MLCVVRSRTRHNTCPHNVNCGGKQKVLSVSKCARGWNKVARVYERGAVHWIGGGCKLHLISWVWAKTCTLHELRSIPLKPRNNFGNSPGRTCIAEHPRVCWEDVARIV